MKPEITLNKTIPGGLLSSTLLNIYIVAVVYSLLNGRGIINKGKL